MMAKLIYTVEINYYLIKGKAMSTEFNEEIRQGCGPNGGCNCVLGVTCLFNTYLYLVIIFYAVGHDLTMMKGWGVFVGWGLMEQMLGVFDGLEKRFDQLVSNL